MNLNDVYNECKQSFKDATNGLVGCCGTSQCPNVVNPYMEFLASPPGYFGPRIEWMFHHLCGMVGEQRTQIAKLEKELELVKAGKVEFTIQEPSPERAGELPMAFIKKLLEDGEKVPA